MKLFNFLNKPKVEYINVMYECIFITYGIVLRNLDTREYKAFEFIENKNKREEKKMAIKVMISQPMKGKTNEQIREERQELVRRLEEDGMEVIDTIISENPPKDMDEAIFYLSKSIEFIGRVDKVIFMKGWEKARGCKIEHQVAIEYGKEVIYIN